MLFAHKCKQAVSSRTVRRRRTRQESFAPTSAATRAGLSLTRRSHRSRLRQTRTNGVVKSHPRPRTRLRDGNQVILSKRATKIDRTWLRSRESQNKYKDGRLVICCSAVTRTRHTPSASREDAGNPTQSRIPGRRFLLQA